MNQKRHLVFNSPIMDYPSPISLITVPTGFIYIDAGRLACVTGHEFSGDPIYPDKKFDPGMIWQDNDDEEEMLVFVNEFGEARRIRAQEIVDAGIAHWKTKEELEGEHEDKTVIGRIFKKIFDSNNKRGE
jgi:hypothetical protein